MSRLIRSWERASINSLFFSPRSLLQTTARSCPFSTLSPKRTTRTAVPPGELSRPSGSATVPTSTTSPAKREWTRAKKSGSNASEPFRGGIRRDRVAPLAGRVLMSSDRTTSGHRGLGLHHALGAVRRPMGRRLGRRSRGPALRPQPFRRRVVDHGGVSRGDQSGIGIVRASPTASPGRQDGALI